MIVLIQSHLHVFCFKCILVVSVVDVHLLQLSQDVVHQPGDVLGVSEQVAGGQRVLDSGAAAIEVDVRVLSEVLVTCPSPTIQQHQRRLPSGFLRFSND